MNLLVMFLLIALAALVWWLLTQQLREKSWLAPSATVETAAGNNRDPAFDMAALATQQSPKLIGLGVFIAVMTALFGLFAAAYHMRMAVPDWTHLPLPQILRTNTFLLAASSVALQWTWSISARGGNPNSIRRGLTAALGLTLAFLLGQILAWRQLDASGFYFSCTPATAFFYLLSGLHGLHLIGGFLVLAKSWIKINRTGDLAVAKIVHVNISDTPTLSIKLCALYWHYLLLLWLALYALFAFT